MLKSLTRYLLCIIFVLDYVVAKVINPNHMDYLFKKIEKSEKLPKDLLKAVSIVETNLACDWVIGVNGQGYYFATQEEALKKINELLKTTSNIDIGCMQLNLAHHKLVRENIAYYIIPENNIRYAAQLLKRLKTKAISWKEAVARYHSFNIDLNQKYQTKVFKAWGEVRNKKFSSSLVSKVKMQVKKKPLQRHYIDVFYDRIDI